MSKELPHEEAVERYFAAMYPHGKEGNLSPVQTEEVREIIAELYDLQDRLDCLAEDAGNAVLLSASAMMDDVITELETFDIPEKEPASASAEEVDADIEDEGKDGDDEGEELPF